MEKRVPYEFTEVGGGGEVTDIIRLLIAFHVLP